MRRTFTALSLAAALLATAIPQSAFAQETESTPAVKQSGGLLDRSEHTRPQMISGFLFLPWYYGFGIGVGGRYLIPIVPDGFIPALNDEFDLEFGADLAFGWFGVFGTSYGYTDVAIPAEALWQFHFTPKFSAYAKVALGLDLRFSSFSSVVDTGAHVYWDVAPGIIFRFADTIAPRAEIGYTGPRVGLGFSF